MKKVLIATNILFIGIILYQACKPAQISIGSVKCPQCKDYTYDNFSGIPASLVAHMMSNYTQNYWPLHTGVGNSAVNPAPDARSIWFSLDTLKKFIWHIESALCKDSCIDRTSLGIRIYYAQYPNQSSWSILDNDPNHQAKMSSYQLLHTAFMVPTYFNGTKNLNVDFDPRFIGNNGESCNPTPIWQVMQQLGVSVTHATSGALSIKSAPNAGFAFVLAPNLETFNKNDGSLIPPPPPQNFVSSYNGGDNHGAGFIDYIDGYNITY